jgi:hypothetical protein
MPVGLSEISNKQHIVLYETVMNDFANKNAK